MFAASTDTDIQALPERQGLATPLRGFLSFSYRHHQQLAAGIDRKVTEFDEVEGVNKYILICETSSSKFARATHVDMMAKVQINLYAAGLQTLCC